MEYDPDVHSLQCPKCGSGMAEVSHEDVVIDRCLKCMGLWFDADEAHRLKRMTGSEALDIGDPQEGWKWDSHGDIDCPRCGRDMEASSDPVQKHIWYEVCPEHGIFMDAGEFTDYKFETLLDWLRSFIKGNRATTAP